MLEKTLSIFDISQKITSMNKPTISIGIPAHNEESNILRLLDSILSQRQTGFRLEKIIVACDGCTDNTANLVLEYQKKYPMIHLIDDGKRFGQAGRCNNFYMENTSDVIVTLDADTTLGARNSLSHLIEPFTNPKVGLVAGADRPYAPMTFFESVAVTVVDLWYLMRRNYNNGDTIHNCHGCILALRNNCAKKIDMPMDINGNDHFVYFRAKELGWKFHYASKALLHYREPSTLWDFIKQRSRFHSINGDMVEHFGKWIEPYYAPLPPRLKMQAIMLLFLQRPLRLSLALSLEVFMRVYIYFHQPLPARGVWEMVQSTKH